MVITELSLVEYYDKIIPRAKRKNYKWVISVIARHADAKELYQHIEEDWASINELISGIRSCGIFCAIVRNTSSKIVLCSVVFFSLASDSGAATMSVFPM